MKFSFWLRWSFWVVFCSAAGAVVVALGLQETLGPYQAPVDPSSAPYDITFVVKADSDERTGLVSGERITYPFSIEARSDKGLTGVIRHLSFEFVSASTEGKITEPKLYRIGSRFLKINTDQMLVKSSVATTMSKLGTDGAEFVTTVVLTLEEKLEVAPGKPVLMMLEFEPKNPSGQTFRYKIADGECPFDLGLTVTNGRLKCDRPKRSKSKVYRDYQGAYAHTGSLTN